MRKKRILFADDEASIRDFVSRGLEDFGYDVVLAEDGEQAWNLFSEAIDLMILDIRMPSMSGIEVCQRLRREQGYQLPVLMLTALGTTDDIVMGLHAGADDYVVKPFKFMELLARIEALFRRVELGKNRGIIEYMGLQLNPINRKATYGSSSIELTTKEYRLLEYFMVHHDEVLSRRQLLRDVWDRDFDTNTNVVDVYVNYLRSKIEVPFGLHLIHTIVGMGYTCKLMKEEAKEGK